MAILQRIFMLGASCLILRSSSMVSAVVMPMLFSAAHSRSSSSLMGFEQTISAGDSPEARACWISFLEAQSMPAPALASSLQRRLIGLDLMAQQGLIQGRVENQFWIFLLASKELQTMKLVDWGLDSTKSAIWSCCSWLSLRGSVPLRKQTEQPDLMAAPPMTLLAT